jgi:hypothetical protein
LDKGAIDSVYKVPRAFYRMPVWGHERRYWPLPPNVGFSPKAEPSLRGRLFVALNIPAAWKSTWIASHFCQDQCQGRGEPKDRSKVMHRPHAYEVWLTWGTLIQEVHLCPSIYPSLSPQLFSAFW